MGHYDSCYEAEYLQKYKEIKKRVKAKINKLSEHDIIIIETFIDNIETVNGLVKLIDKLGEIR